MKRQELVTLVALRAAEMVDDLCGGAVIGPRSARAAVERRTARLVRAAAVTGAVGPAQPLLAIAEVDARIVTRDPERVASPATHGILARLARSDTPAAALRLDVVAVAALRPAVRVRLDDDPMPATRRRRPRVASLDRELLDTLAAVDASPEGPALLATVAGEIDAARARAVAARLGAAQPVPLVDVMAALTTVRAVRRRPDLSPANRG